MAGCETLGEPGIMAKPPETPSSLTNAGPSTVVGAKLFDSVEVADDEPVCRFLDREAGRTADTRPGSIVCGSDDD